MKVDDNMQKTYIFGHRMPDTDSVTAAIGLSYLKNKLGENTEARILGSINKETSFALNYFNVKVPKYLNDVRLQLRDVNYHKGYMIKDTSSIYDAYQEMLRETVSGIPICKDNGALVGLITFKDLSRNLVNDNVEDLYTSYDNIIRVLKGEEIVKIDEEIIGKIMVATYRSTTFMSNVNLSNKDVLIVGDRHSVIEYAINSKVKLLLISDDAYIKDEHIALALENGVNIIRTPYDTFHVSKLISLANYVKTMLDIYEPKKFYEHDFVSDILEIYNKDKHTNYPVVNKNNKCLGMLKITDLADKNPKKVILVDHNEKLQSAEGLEEAQVLEIFDHHALGNLTTVVPINYRNMVVGSTSTIIYTLFKEAKEEIPRDIAGILLSGILSDTLILKSPTATAKDRMAVLDLALNAGVDYKKYGMELFRAGTSLEGMSLEDVLYNDYKQYTVSDKTFAIGQFFTLNFNEIKANLDDYVLVLDKVANQNNFTLVALYVTDIVKNGSYVIFNQKARTIMEIAYQDEVDEGYFIEGCVSRKKHIVPIIMPIIES